MSLRAGRRRTRRPSPCGVAARSRGPRATSSRCGAPRTPALRRPARRAFSGAGPSWSSSFPRSAAPLRARQRSLSLPASGPEDHRGGPDRRRKVPTPDYRPQACSARDAASAARRSCSAAMPSRNAWVSSPIASGADRASPARRGGREQRFRLRAFVTFPTLSIQGRSSQLRSFEAPPI